MCTRVLVSAKDVVVINKFTGIIACLSLKIDFFFFFFLLININTESTLKLFIRKHRPVRQ